MGLEMDPGPGRAVHHMAGVQAVVIGISGELTAELTDAGDLPDDK